jgi:hypothetical protein
MARNKFVAVAAATLLAAAPVNGNAAALGVIAHAEHAQLGHAPASVGSTIYDGDNVSTGLDGTLLLSGRAVSLELSPQSSVTIRQQPHIDGGILAELAAGILVFSAAQNAIIAVTVNGASIRPAGNGSVIAYVRIASKRELLIAARRGTVEFSYRGESETIQEGQTCRLLLDPSEREVAAATESDQDKKRLTKRHRAFLLRAIEVAVPVILIPVIIPLLESPDRPG